MQIFGVSFDDIETNRAFAEKHGFPFPLLCDTERRLGLAFGACTSADTKWAARYTFVVDPEGVIEQALETQDPAAQAGKLVASLR